MQFRPFIDINLTFPIRAILPSFLFPTHPPLLSSESGKEPRTKQDKTRLNADKQQRIEQDRITITIGEEKVIRREGLATIKYCSGYGGFHPTNVVQI